MVRTNWSAENSQIVLVVPLKKEWKYFCRCDAHLHDEPLILWFAGGGLPAAGQQSAVSSLSHQIQPELYTAIHAVNTRQGATHSPFSLRDDPNFESQPQSQLTGPTGDPALLYRPAPRIYQITSIRSTDTHNHSEGPVIQVVFMWNLFGDELLYFRLPPRRARVESSPAGTQPFRTSIPAIPQAVEDDTIV